MFSSAHHTGQRRAFAGSYGDVDASTAIEDASPHKLVSLLYGAVARDIAMARGAIARGDIAAKGSAIGHAVRIIQEGLSMPLDLQGGGALAANLRDLYDYMVRQLTLANLHSDDARLVECIRLVELLRDGWDGIAPQAAAPVRAAA